MGNGRCLLNKNPPYSADVLSGPAYPASFQKAGPVGVTVGFATSLNAIMIEPAEVQVSVAALVNLAWKPSHVEEGSADQRGDSRLPLRAAYGREIARRSMTFFSSKILQCCKVSTYAVRRSGDGVRLQRGGALISAPLRKVRKLSNWPATRTLLAN